MDREVAYMRLAQELGIERDACHMSMMNTETARRVPAAVKAIWMSLKGRVNPQGEISKETAESVSRPIG